LTLPRNLIPAAGMGSRLGNYSSCWTTFDRGAEASISIVAVARSRGSTSARCRRIRACSPGRFRTHCWSGWWSWPGGRLQVGSAGRSGRSAGGAWHSSDQDLRHAL